MFWALKFMIKKDILAKGCASWLQWSGFIFCSKDYFVLPTCIPCELITLCMNELFHILRYMRVFVVLPWIIAPSKLNPSLVLYESAVHLFLIFYLRFFFLPCMYLHKLFIKHLTRKNMPIFYFITELCIKRHLTNICCSITYLTLVILTYNFFTISRYVKFYYCLFSRNK